VVACIVSRTLSTAGSTDMCTHVHHFCGLCEFFLGLQEDVLYALSQADALRDLEVKDASTFKQESVQKMLYLLTPEGSSTGTLTYLRSVYNTPGQPRTHWANFVERVRDIAAARNIKNVPKVVNEVRMLELGQLCSCAGWHYAHLWLQMLS